MELSNFEGFDSYEPGSNHSTFLRLEPTVP